MATNMSIVSKIRRPYTPPQVVVHGTAQDLTRGKIGDSPDLDGGGSNFPSPG